MKQGPLGGELTPKDALFHEPFEGDWRFAETNWFSFLVPEIPLRGHIMNLFRPNLGVVRSQVFMYTAESSRHILGWEFAREDFHLPYEGDLDDYRIPNGLHVQMTKPFEHWVIRYDSGLDTHFELEFEALMPAICTLETKIDEAGPGYSVFHRQDPDAPKATGHIDQIHNVTGEVVLNGERYSVDFPSAHDHSWSPRREFGHNVIGNFDHAHFGRDFSVSVQTRNDQPHVGTVTNGYVLDHGEVFALKGGEARYTMEGWLTRSIDYEVEDTRGKTYRLHGEVEALVEHASVNAYSTCSVIRWTEGGREGDVGWGESAWHWDVQKMQGAIRDGDFGWSRDFLPPPPNSNGRR
jgi:hypothetical protein